jgi:hypothetical protein
MLLDWFLRLILSLVELQAREEKEDSCVFYWGKNEWANLLRFIAQMIPLLMVLIAIVTVLFKTLM